MIGLGLLYFLVSSRYTSVPITGRFPMENARL